MIRKLLSTAALVAALTVGGFAAPAHSSASAAAASSTQGVAALGGPTLAAAEIDYAVGGGPVYVTRGCTENSYGEACFQLYGDGIYLVANASGVYARWSNYLWNGSAWQYYRDGECRATLIGTWSHCNKDFYEDSTNPNAFGSQGSGIRLSLCSSGGVCSPETWTRNNG